MSATCPVKPLVQAWPPVLEYTCVSSTITRIGLPLASSRLRFWKPMSIIAPSPPIETIGGQRKNSSSVNCCHESAASSGSCTAAS